VITSRHIQRLPQVVADSIAAGEVIERPASVVKELVENALDAGARGIDIDVDGGGLIRIEVVDDGDGIAAEDLDLAVARHATSKITAVDDLARVATLGFRGEALASIAAVSELRITSRTRSETAAAAMHVRAGDIVERSIAAAAPGTRVEVLELFATTPARLRFLRSSGAEASAASRVVCDLAIAHPEVAFTCRCDERVVLRSPGGTLHDALRAVFGARAAKDLIDIDSDGAVAVRGALSAPHAHRGTRTGLVLVVNGRRVHNRSLLVAVDEVYRGLIPSGRHPYGVVVVEISPAAVDVNVHPSKREVRFSDERGVFAAVQRACWAALRSAPPAGAVMYPPPAEAATPAVTLHFADATGNGSAVEPPMAMRTGQAGGLHELGPMRALGQVEGKWMVAAASGAVVLIDPHAAHEKIVYMRLLDEWEHGGEPDAQLLLLPAVIECGPMHVHRLETHAAFVASCGMGVEVFGAGTLRCFAVPAAAHAADPQRLVLELLDSLEDDGRIDSARRHRVAALIACHGAVRFGDRISIDEQQRILDDLLQTPGGMTCPHGRPTVVVLDDATLRRTFRRPQL
jgi:DNA mismatch repair protein MutL